MIGLLEVVVLSAVAVGAAVWILVVLVAPRSRPRPAPPGPLAARARLLLYAPLWVPALVVVASIAPKLFGALFGLGDHCAAHAGHHHHLCLLHPPHAANHPLLWLIIAAVLVPALVAVGRTALTHLRDGRLAAALVRSSRPSTFGPDVRLLDQREPIALTVGVLRPTVLLSTGLIAAVSAQALPIIIAHERAHVRRRDTAWALVDSLAGAMLPAKVRRRLLRDVALAREQACDLAAARDEGSLRVAASLTEVARLGLGQPAFGMSAGAASLEARVVHLLDPPSVPRWWPAAPLACVVAVAVLGGGPLHDLLERVLALLLH